MKSKIHQDSLVLARRIRAAGIPIYIGEDDGGAPRDLPSGLLVYEDGRPNETRAFDFYGAAGYIINVVITVNLPHFAISGFCLELPWNSYVRWLDDPIESDGHSGVYRFDRGYLLEFERNQVLNRFADVRRIWSRGESLKGYLLGVGDQPIPNQFEQGAMIPAVLIIYDQFWREYRWPVSLWRDRTEKPVRHDRSGMRRKGGLLDHRDPIADG